MESRRRVFLFVCLFVCCVVTQDAPTCGQHEQYSTRHPLCKKTCSDPNPVCIMHYAAGCFCIEGYVRATNGTCILLSDCPRVQVTFVSMETSIDECQPDEVFVWCGWCEGTCSDPRPDCPSSACTRGCLCQPPLLRHYSGHCVEEKNCLPQNCSNPNEEYSCRYGCEARCVRAACLRSPRCTLGCHCARGLHRRTDGQCVTLDKCFE